MFSYQLYSSRNFPPMSATLGDAGPRWAIAPSKATARFMPMMRKCAELIGGTWAIGLTMPTGHFGLAQLEADPLKVIEHRQHAGHEADLLPLSACPMTARPMPPAGGPSARGCRRPARPYRAAGFGFGWHNHDFEFKRAGRRIDAAWTGSCEGGPDLEWEIDVAWVIRGGADPLAWIEALSRTGSRRRM